MRNRKGHYRELFEGLSKKGYLNVRVDGELREILRGMKLDRYKNHNVELVVDKMRVPEAQTHEATDAAEDVDLRRLRDSAKTEKIIKK